MQKFLRKALTLAVLIGFCLPGALPEASAAPPDFSQLAEQMMPSVVNISTSKTVQRRSPVMPGPGGDLFDEFFERFFRGMPEQRPRQQQSLGSGFIISADGYILTNDHVVNGADEIKVRLADGRSFDAHIKGTDTKLDLALLKIDTGETLPVAPLGDSDDLKIGEWVMAIGNPFGLNQTVTVGIVSAKGRVIGAGPYDDFIQTDASINPGNSGGPLFNMRGEVVGINTAIVAHGQGIGFAIPINAAQIVLPQLREEGRVTRGYLGVQIQPVTDELAASFGLKESRGALVVDVIAGTPAEEAGLQRGDIILEFDGRKIDSHNDLPRLVAATPVGKQSRLKIWRDGRTRDMRITVGRLGEEAPPVERPAVGESDKLGLTLGELTAEQARRFDLEGKQGALITEIEPGGPAAAANLRPGDLIVEVSGRSISSTAELQQILATVSTDQVLRLLVQRRDGLFYTTIKAR
ncbi:DegQ family serine endoprotease [Geoalkalibacter halelectricus]|uniref:Probable periplasmic serine endoprotease DegP-like n=1 Tax=Geoalkalibacter halelectricus TaxID=2847045 RepID=A0ABY5ZQI8_9BACT|nr:DegQ family serine endoprotease [Geoalkalibacter halelectricus]MDO3378531.1 DegQ family serine endoprotease [Geoalkalibacter halelectricus]UWZ80155.1 DegQ family serine endoprotease [Geoalkalibacter halelectricus]